jgi:hypothetical protein
MKRVYVLIWLRCEIKVHSLYTYISVSSRSQWPRGLRYELSSPAQTLGSWVRIQLESWLSVFVLSCMQVAALQQADPPSKESYRLCKKIKKLIKRGPRSNKGL